MHHVRDWEPDEIPYRTPTNNSPYPQYPYEVSDIYYESLSDAYSFRMPGHSGSFVLSPFWSSFAPGELITNYRIFNTTQPYGNYLVSAHMTQSTPNICHDIRMSTGDGYRYYFGGSTPDEPTLEHGKSYQDEFPSEMYSTWSSGAKLSWPLKEIEAPNGRKVELNYTQAVKTQRFYMGGTIKDKYDMVPDDAYDLYCGTYHVTRRPAGMYSFDQRNLHNEFHSHLKTIDFGNILVEFTYRPGGLEYIGVAGANEQPLENFYGQLDRIDIYKVNDNGGKTPIKTCQFHYTKPGNSHARFLESVHISDEGNYRMSYYDLRAKFPKYGTVSTDPWGYYNLNNNDDILNPGEPRYVGDGFNHFKEEENMPNLENTRQGMLQQISYPTGGISEFEYELHDYGHTLCRKAGSLESLFVTRCEPKQAGGLRIKKISNYAHGFPISPTATREFFYTEQDVDSGISTSSGVSLMFPYYLHTPGKGFEEATPYAHSSTEDNYHIEYSKVKEVHNDGSSTVYEFTSWLTHPDLNINMAKGTPRTDLDSKNPAYNDVSKNSLERRPTTRHMDRGKLLKKSIYSKDHEWVYKLENSYAYSKQVNWDNHPFGEVAYNALMCYIKKINTYETVLSGSKETHFSNGKQFTVNTDYTNSITNHCVSSTTIDSKGNEIRKDRIYMEMDSVVANTPALIVIRPSETLRGRYASDGVHLDPDFLVLTDDDIEIERPLDDPNMNIVRWNLGNNEEDSPRYGPDTCIIIIHPDRPWLLETMTSPRRYAGYLKQEIDYLNGKVVFGRKYNYQMDSLNLLLRSIDETEMDEPSPRNSNGYRYVEKENYKYDRRGRVIEANRPYGNSTYYIWGYDNRYVVAKIDGPPGLDIAQDSSIGYLESLYDMAGCMVTLYEYNLPYGVSKITDPSGRETHYSYDQRGKLKEVRNDRNELIKSYDYGINTLAK